jgi:hypothetical protein
MVRIRVRVSIVEVLLNVTSVETDSFPLFYKFGLLITYDFLSHFMTKITLFVYTKLI